MVDRLPVTSSELVHSVACSWHSVVLQVQVAPLLMRVQVMIRQGSGNTFRYAANAECTQCSDLTL